MKESSVKPVSPPFCVRACDFELSEIDPYPAYLAPPTSASHSTVIHSISAGSAGAIATMITQPFDVIKASHLILLSYHASKISCRQKYRSVRKTDTKDS
jgi:hypothetical protein